MQLSRLLSALPNLLDEPLGILSQENKGHVPGNSQLWGFAPKGCKLFEVSLALPCPAPASMALPWDLPGLCDIPPPAQAEQFTALNELLAQNPAPSLMVV